MCCEVIKKKDLRSKMFLYVDNEKRFEKEDISL